MTALRAIAVTLAALAAMVLGVAGIGRLFAHSATRTLRVTAPVRRLEITSDAGRVDVRRGAAGAVVIRRHSTSSFGDPEVRQVLKAGVLSVRSACASNWLIFRRCSSDVVVMVPPGTEVSVTTADGDVGLEGLDGTVTVRTRKGDVTAAAMTSRSIDVQVSAGSLTVAATRPPATLLAVALAGDVAVAVPTGAYAVRTQTVDGAVTVTGITRDAAAPRRIRVQTAAGDITIAASLPAATPRARSARPV